MATARSPCPQGAGLRAVVQASRKVNSRTSYFLLQDAIRILRGFYVPDREKVRMTTWHFVHTVPGRTYYEEGVGTWKSQERLSTAGA